jgi:hypothetical protein
MIEGNDSEKLWEMAQTGPLWVVGCQLLNKEKS